VGTVRVPINASVYVVGVFALGLVQRPLVWGTVNDNQTPNWQLVNKALGV
jgi:hypothetical protein